MLMMLVPDPYYRNRRMPKSLKDFFIYHENFMELNELLDYGSTGKIEMEDGASSILVNSDSTDFFPAGQKPLKIDTLALKIALKEFMKNNPY